MFGWEESIFTFLFSDIYFLMGYDFDKLVAISQEKRSSLSVRTNRT